MDSIIMDLKSLAKSFHPNATLELDHTEVIIWAWDECDSDDVDKKMGYYLEAPR